MTNMPGYDIKRESPTLVPEMDVTKPYYTTVKCGCPFMASGEPGVAEEAFANHSCPQAPFSWANAFTEVWGSCFGFLRKVVLYASVIWALGIVITGHFLPWKK